MKYSTDARVRLQFIPVGIAGPHSVGIALNELSMGVGCDPAMLNGEAPYLARVDSLVREEAVIMFVFSRVNAFDPPC